MSFGIETPRGKGVQGHYVPVSFGRENPSDKGVQATVGVGGYVLGGEAYGVSVGGMVGEGGLWEGRGGGYGDGDRVIGGRIL